MIGAAGVVFAPPLLAVQQLRAVAPIFLYHRVSPVEDTPYALIPPETFDEHCEFLAKKFTVLPLSELIERAADGLPIRECCAISFDDGYLDFREHAFPILRRHGLPVTHFLVADCVADGLPPWTDRLNCLALAHGWSVAKTNATRQRVGAWDAERRRAWLTENERSTNGAKPHPAMLRAADVQAIGSDVDWGSHTTSHGFLDRLSDGEIEREVTGSRSRLEALTGTAVRLLAYPNSYFNERTCRAVESAGYAAALTVGDAPLTPRSSRFAVPRFDVGGHPRRMLSLEATGVLGALRRLRPS